MVIDLETRTVSQVIQKNDEISFKCWSQSFMLRQDIIVSLVRDKDFNRKLIRYSQSEDKITTVCNFGK